MPLVFHVFIAVAVPVYLVAVMVVAIMVVAVMVVAIMVCGRHGIGSFIRPSMNLFHMQ